MSKLFRKQVIEKNRLNYYSQAVVVTPVSYSIILFFIFVAAIIILIFLFNNEYSKKEKVKGYLVPKNGVSKVYSHVSGVVSKINVKEGSSVRKGDTLLSVSNNKFIFDSVNADKEKINEINKQIKIIKNQLVQTHGIFNESLSRLKKIISIQKKEVVELQKQGQFLRKRLAISKNKLSDINELQRNGNASKSESINQLDLVLELQQRIQEHNTIVLRSEVNLSNASNDMAKLPYEQQQQIGQLNRELSQLVATRIAIQEGSNLVLKSQVDGIITSINLNVGEYTSQGDYLVSILPENSELEAELYIPTRAIGFIKNGDVVNIKFDAFPFQKFGISKGNVLHIAKSIVFAAETASKISFNEPVYKVTVKLKKQYIDAYGDKTLFIPGMLLQADIITGKRSLIEWLLEPLYILNGY